MNREVFHKVDIPNFSEVKREIIQNLEKTDFLHIQALNEALGHLNRGQLMCALDALEREGTVEIRKMGSDLYAAMA